MIQIALEEDRYYKSAEWCINNQEKYIHETDRQNWSDKLLGEYEQLKMLEESTSDDKTKLFCYEKIKRAITFFKNLDEPKQLKADKEGIARIQKEKKQIRMPFLNTVNRI